MSLLTVRADQDWVRTATFAATSEVTGYEAEQAGTDDPSAPWWATSGTATLTVTLPGSPSSPVGIIALIMTNADHGRAITLGGGITGGYSLTGARTASGYPVDLAVIIDPPQNLSQVTFAISGNSVPWSIGRVVIGALTELTGNNLLIGASIMPSRPQYSDENDFGHDIRYDLGVERWRYDGELLNPAADQATVDAFWHASLGGFYPTLFWPYPEVYPPIFGRMTMALARRYVDATDISRTPFTITDVCRGLEVVP